jgi:hypothetical protein
VHLQFPPKVVGIIVGIPLMRQPKGKKSQNTIFVSFKKHYYKSVVQRLATIITPKKAIGFHNTNGDNDSQYSCIAWNENMHICVQYTCMKWKYAYLFSIQLTWHCSYISNNTIRKCSFKTFIYNWMFELSFWMILIQEKSNETKAVIASFGNWSKTHDSIIWWHWRGPIQQVTGTLHK